MSSNDQVGEYFEYGPTSAGAADVPDGAGHVRRLLDSPEVWADPPPAALDGVLDGVLDRIRAERSAGQAPESTATKTPPATLEPPATPKLLPTPRELARQSAARTRPWRGRQLLAAAAAAALFLLGGVAGWVVAGGTPDPGGATRNPAGATRDPAGAPRDPAGAPPAPAGARVELAGTALARGASGQAVVRETESGFAISLDVTGLPPAAPGTFYEGWVRAPGGDRVSIGTFHLRGGAETIELWSGVDVGQYSTLTVTVQRERAPAAVKGPLVLSGAIPPLR